MKKLCFGSFLGILFGVIACSGSSSTNLLESVGNDGGRSSSGGGSSSGAASSTSSGGASSSGAALDDASASTSSSSGGGATDSAVAATDGALADGTTSVDGSGPADGTLAQDSPSEASPPDAGGASEAGDDSATVGDAAEDASGSGIACGNATCTLPGQTCCASFQNNHVATNCVDGMTCPDPNATALRCESTADCPATMVCCAFQRHAGTLAQCQMFCGGGDDQLCDPNAQDPGCLQGQRCRQPNGGAPPLPDGVDICGG